MIASTLKDAIPLLDPSHPLPGEDSFYEERETPREEIKTLLLYSGAPQKILFTGFRGAGKSTELNILSQDEEIRDKFIVVKFSAESLLNISSLDYIDLLFIMGEQIFRECNSIPGADLPLNLLEALQHWGQEVQTKVKYLEGSQAKLKAAAGVGIKTALLSFFAEVSGLLKVGYSKETEIKKTLQPKIMDLWNAINNIIGAVESTTGKQVLLIIEDLDKAIIEPAEILFAENGQTLLKPKCHIIYTIPVALIYSDKSTIIKQTFNGYYILPNIKIFKKDGNKEPGNFDLMEKVIKKRMNFDSLAENPNDTIEKLIEYSGGVMRELIRLTQDAVIKAVSKRKEKLDMENVDKSIDAAKNSFITMNIKKESLEYLKNVEKSKQIIAEEDSIAKTLLHNLSILQYQNAQNWFDVNPLLKEYIVSLHDQHTKSE